MLAVSKLLEVKWTYRQLWHFFQFKLQQISLIPQLSHILNNNRHKQKTVWTRFLAIYRKHERQCSTTIQTPRRELKTRHSGVLLINYYWVWEACFQQNIQSFLRDSVCHGYLSILGQFNLCFISSFFYWDQLRKETGKIQLLTEIAVLQKK